MSQIVHMQTQITVMFGLLSDDGTRQDPQDPVTATLSEFSEDAFRQAYEQIKAEHERRSAAFMAPEPEKEPSRTRSRSTRTDDQASA